MDPLERYTFKEDISGQELKGEPSHTTQIPEPSQGGGASLKYSKQALFWWIHSVYKAKVSTVLQEEKQ